MFSLRMLLIGTAIAAFFAAALIGRTPAWIGAATAVTHILFAIALTVGILSVKRRAFCIPFVIFGVGYLAAGYGRYENWSPKNLTEPMFEWIGKTVDSDFERMLTIQRESLKKGHAMDWATGSDYDFHVVSRLTISHLFCALIVGTAAGLITVWIVRRQARANGQSRV